MTLRSGGDRSQSSADRVVPIGGAAFEDAYRFEEAHIGSRAAGNSVLPMATNRAPDVLEIPGIWSEFSIDAILRDLIPRIRPEFDPRPIPENTPREFQRETGPSRLRQPQPKPQTEISFSRDQLRRNGINPDRVSTTIGVLEPIFAVTAPGEDHGTLVSGIIEDFIPRAPIQMFRPDSLGSLESFRTRLLSYKNRPNGLDDFISDTGCSVFNSMSDTLSRLLDSSTTDPALRVFNMSLGFSRVGLYENIMQMFQQHPDKFQHMIASLIGEDKARQWLQQMRSPAPNEGGRNGDAPPSLTAELMQAIVAHVDQQLDRNPLFVQAMQRYQEVTRSLANRGIILVVGASNDGSFAARWGVKIQAGAEFNFLASSNHVISVGAVNGNGTAGRPKDDFPAAFSSAGGPLFRPTLLAPGEGVQLGISTSGTFDGTSCAAPHVSATVALMLEQNPSLSFQDVVRLLRQNSYHLPGVSDYVQGAGVLEMHSAILAARASRRR